MEKQEYNELIEKLLRLNLQEEEYPYFNSDDLRLLYESNDYSIPKTCWRACLLKATTDDMVKVGPIEVKSSLKDYWLKLAEMFYNEYLDEVERDKRASGKSKFKNVMLRYDGQ